MKKKNYFIIVYSPTTLFSSSHSLLFTKQTPVALSPKEIFVIDQFENLKPYSYDQTNPIASLHLYMHHHECTNQKSTPHPHSNCHPGTGLQRGIDHCNKNLQLPSAYTTPATHTHR